VRQKALVIAYAVHETGRREVIGIDLGEAETEAFWRDFLRSLRSRGLEGVKLCVSDAHTGLKNAIGQVLGVPWQRCTVHFLRDMLGHVQKSQQQMVGAAIRQVFAASSREEAGTILRDVCDRLAAPAAKVAALLAEAEDDLLAFSASRSSTAQSCGRPTRWSGSTVKSRAAPMWSGSIPTTTA
jgi:putative transposase